MNAVDPSISHAKFSKEEDIQILRLYLEHGSKWHDLANYLNEIQIVTEDGKINRRSEI